MTTVTEIHDRTERIEQPAPPPAREPDGSWLVDPTQLVSAVAGVYLLVTGIVAVARAGFFDSGLFDPEVIVGGLHHTPLLALIEIGFGLLVLAAGTLDRNANAVTFLGVLAVVVGLVWLIEPASFRQWLGVTTANGWQHIITGVALAGAAQIPAFRMRRPGADGHSR